jgi:hypothetical protein
MSMRYRTVLCAAVVCEFALISTTTCGQDTKAPAEVKLPPAVLKTFAAKFPKGQIEKKAAEKEEGVMVYDLEFRDGRDEKETDITEDGTMLEWTLVIQPKDVPAAAMKPIREAAQGATMGRTERIEVSYEPKEGKVVKLAKPETHYAVELKKGELTAEIIVNLDGKVLEPPKWVDQKQEPAAKASGEIKTGNEAKTGKYSPPV